MLDWGGAWGGILTWLHKIYATDLCRWFGIFFRWGSWCIKSGRHCIETDLVQIHINKHGSKSEICCPALCYQMSVMKRTLAVQTCFWRIDWMGAWLQQIYATDLCRRFGICFRWGRRCIKFGRLCWASNANVFMEELIYWGKFWHDYTKCMQLTCVVDLGFATDEPADAWRTVGFASKPTWYRYISTDMVRKVRYVAPLCVINC